MLFTFRSFLSVHSPVECKTSPSSLRAASPDPELLAAILSGCRKCRFSAILLKLLPSSVKKSFIIVNHFIQPLLLAS
ncbi:myotubularin related protein 2 (predicted), isoform CRA_c [Rattus norvegicus]|uniref:Myotubularin related protein 2 (Predicted), isoform CRA_c n=1 Tax=Rattus norvegicus TaxID=10116 RepID=A6JN76_RAT|nr:myotubularin related protein 2 (predicted), isoform CRA_c [Rattus norvegicus]